MSISNNYIYYYYYYTHVQVRIVQMSQKLREIDPNYM